MAQTARRTLGGSGAVGRVAYCLRPRARDRKVRRARILVDHRPLAHGSEGALHRAPGRRRRQEDQPARHWLGRGGRSLQDRARAGALLGRRDRIEAGQAPPLSAVHHFDPAAGGVAEARSRAGAHHADCAAPLRRRRCRRRRGRPHYLYAHRRRRSRARGGCVGATRHRQGFRRQLCAVGAAQIHRQGQERARGARSDPSDRHDEAPSRRRPSSRARAGEALRTHLDAHDRLPDGERGARAHDGRHSG